MLIAPDLTAAAIGETGAPRESIAAGRVLCARENPGCELDEATRTFIRSRFAAVCEVLRYDAEVIRWMAENGLATREDEEYVSVECAARGLVEATAVLTEVVAPRRRKGELEL